MPDKQLTPIQAAIKSMSEELYSMENTDSSIMGKGARCFQIKRDIEVLQSLLPTEKQFAKDVWDGGYNKGYEDAGDHSLVGKKNPVPDFNTFYKHYEP